LRKKSRFFEEICSASLVVENIQLFVRPFADGAKEQGIQFFRCEIFRQRRRNM
jgi:hypothetical protein